MYSASVVSPAKLWTGTGMAAAMKLHNARSSFDPKMAIVAPNLVATLVAASAKRSGSQRFAVP
jgi:hypothetical protein